MKSLQEFSGLTDQDPIWHSFGKLDTITGPDFDWNQVFEAKDELEEILNELAPGSKNLQENFLSKLRKRIKPLANLLDKTDLKFQSKVRVALFLIAAKDLLLEESNQNRNLFSPWKGLQ
jgi:hypothetical protein